MIRRLANWAFRIGMRKGVAGGSGPWLVVAAAAGAYKLMHRPGRGIGGSAHLHLQPGDRYVVVCSEE